MFRLVFIFVLLRCLSVRSNTYSLSFQCNNCNGIPVRDSVKWKRNARLIEINFNYLLNKLWNFERSNTTVTGRSTDIQYVRMK